jgi:hypothetical protein
MLMYRQHVLDHQKNLNEYSPTGLAHYPEKKYSFLVIKKLFLVLVMITRAPSFSAAFVILRKALKSILSP